MIDGMLAALRFGQYAALMLLLGGAAFPLVALRGSVGVIANPWPRRWLAILAVAAIGVALAAMIASVAAMMGVLPWMVELAMVQAIVTGTGIGWAFVIRVAALATALAMLLLVASPRLRSISTVGLSAAALTSLAWSGHAAATPGSMGTLHRLNDAAHLIAAAMWIGAIFGFLLSVRAAHRRPARVEAEPLFDALRRFAPIGLVLVALVSITGILNAQLIFGIADVPRVLAGPYGWLLAAKLGLVGLMLLCAARNATIARRRASVSAVSAAGFSETLRVIRTSLAVEALTGTVVIAIIACLGLMSPV